MFAGREICIATMHQKEKVIAPLLEKHFKLKCITPKNFNTDSFGTFSGEIERIDNPVEAARKKCKLAIELTGVDLAVSSEGSFGAHPYIGFVTCDEEFLLLYDAKNEIEIIVRELTTKTNFDGDDFSTFEKLADFATRVLFPSHSLILKDCSGKHIIKGISNWKDLQTSFNTLSMLGLPVKAETDMRAMFNPIRMEVIKNCTNKLIEAMQSTCPKCNFPGFTVSSVEAGLPCEQCGMPTSSTLKHIFCCKKCLYKTEKMYPHKKTLEESTFCDFCNP